MRDSIASHSKASVHGWEIRSSRIFNDISLELLVSIIIFYNYLCIRNYSHVIFILVIILTFVIVLISNYLYTSNYSYIGGYLFQICL